MQLKLVYCQEYQVFYIILMFPDPIIIGIRIRALKDPGLQSLFIVLLLYSYSGLCPGSRKVKNKDAILVRERGGIKSCNTHNQYFWIEIMKKYDKIYWIF